MGISGHIAFAFEPGNEKKVVSFITDSEFEDESIILYSPEFGLIRENYREMHKLLSFLQYGYFEEDRLDTIVMRNKEIMTIGMGVQYFYPLGFIEYSLREFEKYNKQLFIDTLYKHRSGFESVDDLYMERFVNELFDIFQNICSELQILANNRWAMIAGMF